MAAGRDDLRGVVGIELTVIAWLWARTVKCPNPACGAMMPLVRSFALSTKKAQGSLGRADPRPSREDGTFPSQNRKGQASRIVEDWPGNAKFRCLICSQASPDRHIKDEGIAERMGAQLLTWPSLPEGDGGRVYLSPTDDQIGASQTARPKRVPEEALADDPRNIWCVQYGLRKFVDLFRLHGS